MYGIWKNPDRHIQLTKRMPLTWFDNQKPNEPLKGVCDAVV